MKLGQGLVSMNHILPKEYLETLKVSKSLSIILLHVSVDFVMFPMSSLLSYSFSPSFPYPESFIHDCYIPG